jgi:glycosyltransferase involved in cell wall biosynthesis
MRIAQVILPNASAYERKSQRADFASLSAAHDVVLAGTDEVRESGADVAHVYATGELPVAPFVRFPIPYISSADVRRSRWPFRRATEPDYVVSPVIEKVEQSRYQPLPEVVEEVFFGARRAEGGGQKVAGSGQKVIGSFRRGEVQSMVELTLARIERFRDDVTWHRFDRDPTPEDLASVAAWVDPAIHENDFDGFVAEAIVSGLPVIASRTKINALRLEQGRTGFLVPPRDPNELAHAILAALFKPEVASMRLSAAQQTASKFRSRQRLRVLVHMYETIAT